MLRRSYEQSLCIGHGKDRYQTGISKQSSEFKAKTGGNELTKHQDHIEGVGNLSDCLTDEEYEESEILPVGSLIWSRFGKRWWPALSIEGEMAGQPKSDKSQVWVMWFGDHKISKVHKDTVHNFARNVKEYYNETLSDKHEEAIVEALKVCIDRQGLKVEGYKAIRKWGLDRSGLTKVLRTVEDPFQPKQGSEFPPVFVDKLKKLRDASKDSASESDEDIRIDSDAVSVSDKDVCIACCQRKENFADKHPLFEGSICLQCYNVLIERLLGMDKYGYYMFCGICGNADSLYVCCQKHCGRTFCSTCLKRIKVQEFKNQDKKSFTWKCLLCEKYDPRTHGLLKPRQNWQSQLIQFFNPLRTRPYISPDFTGRKIRVLSLYDGIGTVKQALEGLQLDIDTYYSAECNISAKVVAEKNMKKVNFQDLGSVDDITLNTLKDLCPIDLVIANPPDTELDVTSDYQGFYGDGTAIFKVVSILRDIETLSKGRTVFWMVESTPAMVSNCRIFLDLLLEVKHSMWDAQFVSPYVFPKLYWGNIPGLDRAHQCYGRRTSSLLNTYLDEGRKSRVKMIRKCAIDHQPSKKDCTDERRWKTAIDKTNFQLPVSVDGERSVIRVEEIEKVLGLPEDYSFSTANTLEERQKLLKTAPSVLILKEILKPLSGMFVLKK